MATIRERTREAKGQPAESDRAYKVFKIAVDGEEVIVDQNTFTGKERTLMKRALANLGYAAEAEERAYAAAWITMRRADEKLTFDQVLEAVTFDDYFNAEAVDAVEDDSPEA